MRQEIHHLILDSITVLIASGMPRLLLFVTRSDVGWALEDLVMRDGWLQFQQIAGIEVVILRLLHIFPGELADGVGGVPECEQQEMGHITFHAAHHVDAASAWNRLVVGNRHGTYQVQILIGFGAGVMPCQVRAIIETSIWQR